MFCSLEALREDRQLVRLLTQVNCDLTRTCNWIRRLIEFHGLEKKVSTKSSWTITQYKEAHTALRSLSLSLSLKFSIEDLFGSLYSLRVRKTLILKEIKKLAKAEHYCKKVDLATSVPGIGILTAMRLVLELGDFERFKTKESFSSFLGLIPRDYSTGEQNRKGHITKQGNNSLRNALIECAWISIRKDVVLFGKYQLVKSRCGSGKKAIVAIAHKLALCIRAVVVKKEPYQIGLVSC